MFNLGLGRYVIKKGKGNWQNKEKMENGQWTYTANAYRDLQGDLMFFCNIYEKRALHFSL